MSEKIIASGARHFDSLGYAGSTLDMIRQAENLSRGAVHYHLPSKESVAHQLVQDRFSFAYCSITAAAETGSPGHEQLAFMFRGLAQAVESDTALRSRCETYQHPVRRRRRPGIDTR